VVNNLGSPIRKPTARTTVSSSPTSPLKTSSFPKPSESLTRSDDIQSVTTAATTELLHSFDTSVEEATEDNNGIALVPDLSDIDVASGSRASKRQRIQPAKLC
jgi:hypothetical protein